MFEDNILNIVIIQVSLVLACLVTISLRLKLNKATIILIIIYLAYLMIITYSDDEASSVSNNNINKKFDFIDSSNSSNQVEIVPSNIKLKNNIPFNLKSLKKKISNAKPSLSPLINSSSIKVLNMDTGTQVKNRRIMKPDSVFTLKSNRVYFLSGIQNKIDSTIIYHKWYFSGNLMSKIKMNSGRSFNWRSWSYITTSSQKIGRWKVVVEDNFGTRHDSLFFNIIKD